jgi:hypothetical protein
MSNLKNQNLVTLAGGEEQGSTCELGTSDGLHIERVTARG